MSAPAKKEKRRIVPTHIADSAPAAPANIPRSPEKHKGHDMRPSTYHEEFLKYVTDKHYLKELKQRAIAKGYEKESKKRKITGEKKPRKEKAEKDHGSHFEHLNSLRDYIKEFVKLKSHRKGMTVFEYLEKQFNSGKYYSPTSRRFRKYK